MNETMLDPVTVGTVLAMFRNRKRLSQEVVSGFACIGRTHLSAIERGERKPTLETFYRICLAIGERPSTVLLEIERLNESENQAAPSDLFR